MKWTAGTSIRRDPEAFNALFDEPWSSASPFESPVGLSDERNAVAVLEEAAEEVVARYGSMDVPWGDVVRLRYGRRAISDRARRLVLRRGGVRGSG